MMLLKVNLQNDKQKKSSEEQRSKKNRKAGKAEKGRKAKRSRPAGKSGDAKKQGKQWSWEPEIKNNIKKRKNISKHPPSKSRLPLCKKKCGCMWLAGWHVEIKKYVINKNTHIYICIYISYRYIYIHITFHSIPLHHCITLHYIHTNIYSYIHTCIHTHISYIN